jgi:hypothetical protein
MPDWIWLKAVFFFYLLTMFAHFVEATRGHRTQARLFCVTAGITHADWLMAPCIQLM